MGSIRTIGVAAVAIQVACSATPSHVDADGGSPSGGSGQGGIDIPIGGGAGGGSDAGTSCAGSTLRAEPIPLDIYLMLDASGSMSDVVGSTTTTKWDAITRALSTFFADPASSGIGLGFQYFPLATPGVPDVCTSNSDCPGQSGPCLLRFCDDGSQPCATDADCSGNHTCVPLGDCNGTPCLGIGHLCQNGHRCSQITESVCAHTDSCAASDYATPGVEISPLPDAAPTLGAAITSVTPTGNTPTGAALTGALEHAATWAGAHPNHTVIVLLATDGLPNECSAHSIGEVATIAAGGLTSSPSIKTFAIGVFSTSDLHGGAKANLDQIASAGGTEHSYIVDTSQDVEQGFLTALAAVRGSQLACEYQIPTPTNGQAIDFGQVNVEFAAHSGAPPSTIPFTHDLSACDPQSGGWTYDRDPSKGTPTKILICPSTCSTFGNGGEVDIRVGCKTVVSPPL